MIISSSFLILLLFQNCKYVASTDINYKLAASGGDGEPFQGKLTHTRYIPGFTCNNKISEHSGFIIDGDNYSYVAVDKNSCSKTVTNVAEKDIYKPHYTQEHRGYQGGVYTSEKINRAKEGIFTEALCQIVTKDGRYIADFVVLWDQINKKSTIISYSKSSPNGGTPIALERKLSYEHIQYKGANGFLLNIMHKTTDGTELKARLGAFAGLVENENITAASAKCLMGGEFDPDVVKLVYQPDQKIFAKDEFDEMNLMPTRSINEFRISPELPSGLSLNNKTGNISGSPTDLTLMNSYVIEGVLNYGYVSKVIEIGVGTEFVVATSSNLKDSQPGDSICSNTEGLCSLRAAIDEANLNLNSPTIITLSGQEILLGGDELTISGQLYIRGNDAILNAEWASRHLVLSTDSRLILENISLQKGRSNTAGGSIVATGHSLSLSDVIFSDNATLNEDAKGGAIYAETNYIEINNCLFENNQAALGLSSGRAPNGGAIYSRGGHSLTIDNSKFISNKALLGRGGALDISSMRSVQISNSQFSKNQAMDGGAMEIDLFPSHSNGIVIDSNSFIENAAAAHGGALKIGYASYMTLRNNLFRENSANIGTAAEIERIYVLGVYDNIFEKNYMKYFNYTRNVLVLRLNWLTQFGGNSFLNNPRSIDCRVSLWSTDESVITYPMPTPVGFVDMGNNSLNDDSCTAQSTN